MIGSGKICTFGYRRKWGSSLPIAAFALHGRRLWDVAPDESDPRPDFLRPVTAVCFASGKAQPVADSLNRYEPGVFAAYGITCDRCHGDATAHLRNPIAGSILNPEKLKGAVQHGVCEQCHLTGEVRIPNQEKSITDFKPGAALEDSYTAFVTAQSAGGYQGGQSRGTTGVELMRAKAATGFGVELATIRTTSRLNRQRTFGSVV